MADNFQQLQYNAWESQHLTKHSDLLKRYNELKGKEALLGEQHSGKVTKKNMVLEVKKSANDIKLTALETDKIREDSEVEARYNSNLHVINTRMQKEIEEAKETAELELKKELKKIQARFENSRNYYDSEKKASLDKNLKIYNQSKSSLTQKVASIEAEKAITTKTAAELTIAANKIKILTEIKRSIDIMAMSRSSVSNGNFLYPLPTMPEPLPESTIKSVEQPQPRATATTEEILASLGEDASLAVKRAESQAEDRRLRREAFEEEMQRNEIMLAHRRQMEREADERRADREARERQHQQQQQVVTPPLTQIEEDDMTQEEIDAYIAKRKKERGGK